MAEKKELVHLPNSELEIMMAIWEAKKPVSRLEIDEKISEKNWQAPTVLKFLSRLTEKGFLKCEKPEGAKTNIYTALVSEEEYLEFESNSVLGKFCGRSVKSLVANLYENNTINDSELDELQKFINEAKQKR
ncbi:MAG: BlaI/MecI/CopY family transcriptional regulator [Oscillospiraceae bacterium]|nr:BlaI/MecI/CopY family transcriptional regulator [Oscillospiraceae bacterium]MBQ5322475.1 BlaI/MecI/CopY family transcriptional regulator [Oscillospiraceae bacterium]MBQ8594965.1 BlaI/MecI/CopY family transcriptional regulator [Oscillospiraceae bacterium]